MYFVETILPNIDGLLNEGESGGRNLLYSVEEEHEFLDMIERIVVRCTASPSEVVVHHLCMLLIMLPSNKLHYRPKHLNRFLFAHIAATLISIVENTYLMGYPGVKYIPIFSLSITCISKQSKSKLLPYLQKGLLLIIVLYCL